MSFQPSLVALDNETFSIYRNTGKGGFVEVTEQSGMAALSLPWRAIRRTSLTSTQLAVVVVIEDGNASSHSFRSMARGVSSLSSLKSIGW